MHLVLTTKNNKVSVKLNNRNIVIEHEDLTVSQGFDILLIAVLDKILCRDKMERLSLKNLEIREKMRPGAITSMTLKTVAIALSN